MSNARGIDTSHYNGDITHALTTVDFAIGQASVGLWTDTAYAGDYSAMRRARLAAVGGYHYAVYGPGPTRQAQKFLSVVDGADYLAVDAETRGSNRLLNHPATISAIIVNVRRLDPHKRRILLYASRATQVLVNGVKRSIWSVVTEQDANWVADYVGNPNRPGVHPRAPWLFWQTDDGGGDLDHDVFNGDVAALRAWVKGKHG